MNAVVIILSVHSSSPHLGVAVVRDSLVLAERILPPGREHLENIAMLIGDVLRQSRMTLKAIEGLGVAIGPGSFSGIRIGMATVKGIALAQGTPVVGVSSLEILAQQALREGETGTAVIDARRSEIYVATYKKTDDALAPLDEPSLIPESEFDDYARTFTDSPVLVGDPVVDRLAAVSSCVVRVALVVPSPAACAQRARDHLTNRPSLPVHALLPLYIRRSDAEEKRSVHIT